MKINTRKIKGRMDVHSRENQSIKLIRRVYIPVSSDSLKRTACQVLYFSALTIFTTMRRKFVKKKTASFACTHGLAWTGWAYRSRERQRSSCMKLSGGRVGCQGRTTGLDATCDDLDLRGSSRAGVTSSPSSIATAFLSVRFLRRISWISRPNAPDDLRNVAFPFFILVTFSSNAFLSFINLFCVACYHDPSSCFLRYIA